MLNTAAEHGRMRVTQDSVFDDRLCASCGYNLKGLALSGKCPECGGEIIDSTPIAARAVKRGNTQSIGDATPGYLALLRLAMLAIAMSGVPLPVILGLGVPVGLNTSWASLAAACAIAWTAGSCFLASGIPVNSASADQITPQRRQWRGLRMAVAITQPCTLLVVAAMAARLSHGTQWLIYAQWPLMLAVCFGMVALAVLVSNYAEWAGDIPMMNRLRTFSWFLALLPVVACPILMLSQIHFAFSMFMWIPGLLVLVWFVGLVVLCFSALQMISTTGWAVVNTREARARDARVLERARAHQRANSPASALDGMHGVPLGAGGLVTRHAQDEPDARADEPHSLLPPPGTPMPGERTTLRIEPTHDAPYALEDTNPDEP